MTAWDASLAAATLDSIDLGEVLRVAELQVRKDRKYLVPVDRVDAVLEGVDDDLRILDIAGRRTFRYESLYFDTPDHISYFDAAQRRPRRFKVRIRTYLDSAEAMLEVKVRDGRGSTVKHRRPHDLENRSRLTAEGRDFVSSAAGVGVVDELQPSLRTTYHRSTLVCGRGEARATVDADVGWRNASGSAASLDGVALIETKTPGRPCAVDHALWRLGIRPMTISKYCTGLAALHPELPANKWHRVLRDHLQRRGAPARMHDDEIERAVGAITERVLQRQPHVDETALRRTVEQQFRELEKRATVRSYLEILTERAVCSTLRLPGAHDSSQG